MFDCLFNVFSGQNFKSNWNFVVLGNMCQVVVCIISDIFKVGSVIMNNCIQCNYCVVFIGFSQCICCQWQFIGIRYLNNGNVFIFYLIDMFQCVNCIFQQVVIDKVVEMCDGDGDVSVRGSNVSFNNVYFFFLGLSMVLQGGGFQYNILCVVFFSSWEIMYLLNVGKYLGLYDVFF